MSIIKDLYNGRLYPYEDISPSGIEHRQADAKLEAIYSSLIKRLSQEDMAQIKEWEHLIHLSSDLQAYENFSYGFRLGVILMHEVFSNESGGSCPAMDPMSITKFMEKQSPSE